MCASHTHRHRVNCIACDMCCQPHKSTVFRNGKMRKSFATKASYRYRRCLPTKAMTTKHDSITSKRKLLSNCHVFGRNNRDASISMLLSLLASSPPQCHCIQIENLQTHTHVSYAIRKKSRQNWCEAKFVHVSHWETNDARPRVWERRRRGARGFALWLTEWVWPHSEWDIIHMRREQRTCRYSISILDTNTIYWQNKTSTEIQCATAKHRAYCIRSVYRTTTTTTFKCMK